MHRLTSLLIIASIALVGVAGATALATKGNGAPRSPSPGEPPDLRLQDGATSPDELIDRWLAALAGNDEAELHRLRLSRDEYMAILVPWTVEPGAPPRQVTAEPREFFWQLLDTRSRDLGHAMLQRYGGRRFTPTRLGFSEGAREYAGYRAYGLVRLEALDEAGAPVVVEGPWIAEVAGAYKFIGLDWTD